LFGCDRPGRIRPQELPNALPADAKVEQLTLTTDGQRAYYTTPSGGIWLYDRTRKTSSRIMTGSAWDLTVSPLRDALAYATITGRFSIVGEITELSEAAIGIRGSGGEMLLYFRDTSKFDYSDLRQEPTEANKDRVNKYPMVIETKFSNSDRLEVTEFFS